MNDQSAELLVGGTSAGAERMPATSDRLDGQTVLLVEGDAAAAHDLQETMENAGAEVLVARDAAEALFRMAQFDFSAAVLDWRPEQRQHRAAAQRLRQDGVRILFYGGAHPAQDAITACGDPVLPKPSPADAIVNALAKLTGCARIGREPGIAQP